MLRGGRHLLLRAPRAWARDLPRAGRLRRAGPRGGPRGRRRLVQRGAPWWAGSPWPAVLRAGYGPQTFTPGPLVEAMRAGSVLFVNELNRMPEAVQNVLLPRARRAADRRAPRGRGPGRARLLPRRHPELRSSTWPPGTCPRPCATGSSTSPSPGSPRPRSAPSWPPRPAPRPPSPPGPSASPAPAARISAVRKGASVRAASAAGLALALSPRPGLAERAAAAVAALRTRVDLRDDAGLPFEAVLAELIQAADAVWSEEA
ncbi:MAG: AAA family ATPase [Chloroflexota bacterium]